MTDHAHILADTLGMRPAVSADLPFMIEVAAQCAWTTEKETIVDGPRVVDTVLADAALADRGEQFLKPGRAMPPPERPRSSSMT